MPSAITQFQPGQSGNPTGKRPGTIHLTTAVRNILAGECTPELAAKVLGKKRAQAAYEAGLTGNDLLGMVIVTMAMKGNPKIIAMLWDHVDGKAHQALDVSGNVEHKVSVEAVRKALELVA
jgi:hypothetical protein